MLMMTSCSSPDARFGEESSALRICFRLLARLALLPGPLFFVFDLFRSFFLESLSLCSIFSSSGF